MALRVTTALLIGLSLLLLLLSWSVIQQRRKEGVSLGDGDQLMMRRKIRAQGNLAEYGPMFVLLIAVAEITSGASVLLWVFGLIFFIARVLHGIGLSYTQNSPVLRSMGMVLTLTAFLGAIGLNVLVLLGT